MTKYLDLNSIHNVVEENDKYPDYCAWVYQFLYNEKHQKWDIHQYRYLRDVSTKDPFKEDECFGN